MAKRTNSDQAWQQGRQAALAGEPMEANPFGGGQVHVAWMVGWIDGNNTRHKKDYDNA